MNQIDFLPIGRKVSQIGLGCGRLVGRSTLIQSARIVETALDLGIRYFDVAPSYGMGTAEEVLGHVTGDSKMLSLLLRLGFHVHIIQLEIIFCELPINHFLITFPHSNIMPDVPTSPLGKRP